VAPVINRDTGTTDGKPSLSFYGLSVADLDCINKHFAWRVMQQLEVAPISDSLNVITELLGIKFNIYVFIE